MNTSGEAAEQVMRMSLEGAEILIKLTGSGAKNAAVLLYSIYKEQKILPIYRKQPNQMYQLFFLQL